MPTPNAWIKMPLMNAGNENAPPPPIADSGITTRFMKRYREHAEDGAARDRVRPQNAKFPAGEVVGGDDAERDEEVNEKAKKRRRQTAPRRRRSQQASRDALKDANGRGPHETKDHDRIDGIDRSDGKRAVENRAWPGQFH